MFCRTNDLFLLLPGEGVDVRHKDRFPQQSIQYLPRLLLLPVPFGRGAFLGLPLLMLLPFFALFFLVFWELSEFLRGRCFLVMTVLVGALSS